MTLSRPLSPHVLIKTKNEKEKKKKSKVDNQSDADKLVLQSHHDE